MTPSSKSTTPAQDDTRPKPKLRHVRRMSVAERNLENPIHPLFKIVLTGGPCGGKTTALARVSYYLRERGFEVMTAPEAFTIMAMNGFNPGEFFSVQGMTTEVQQTVMDMQISLEDNFSRVLKARGKPAVLLCDRGLMDGRAYMNAEEWREMLDRKGIESEVDLREGRYNAVFHLVTAAEGAEKYYSLENNEARSESPEEARVVDVQTRNAWVGHPNFKVVDNSTSFEEKMQRLVTATAKLVGLPSALSKETSKYLLNSVPDLAQFPKDVTFQVFHVEKVHLYEEQNKDITEPEFLKEYSFVRKRTHADGTGAVHGVTTVKYTKDGQQIELKRIISQREYAAVLRTRDPSRHMIRQTRISFIWQVQSFNVHIYHEPVEDLCIMHCQVETGHSVNMPPFLDIDRNLTTSQEDEEAYGSYGISIRGRRGSFGIF